jgi:UDP-N-acetylmuramoylalanine--D-glutamate ligase
MKVLILGSGQSGKSADEYLKSMGHETAVFGDRIDLCVTSPGIRVTGELDIAPWHLCEKIVAVTGTNGKTSVVTMIARALGDRAVLCGNVGIPVTAVAEKLRGKIAVVEVSSFQLEIPPRNFKPDISVILNITQDHLDRHGSMKEYAACKRRIRGKVHFQNISNKSAVRKVCALLGVNGDVVERVIRDHETQNKPHRIEHVLTHKNTEFYNDSKATNIASTLFACKKLRRKNTSINLILGGISKGQNFTELFEKLPPHVKNIFVFGRCADEIISAADPQKIGIHKCENLTHAVKTAQQVLHSWTIAAPRQIVLLSPACSSFDLFKNYEDRGEQFKNIVKQLAESV